MSLEEHKQSHKLCVEFLATWKLMSQPQYLLKVIKEFQSSPFCNFQIYFQSVLSTSLSLKHMTIDRNFNLNNCHSVS